MAGNVWLTLTVPNQPDPFLHNRSDVQSIRVPSIRRDYPNSSHFLHRQKRLIQRLAHIRLQRQSFADLVNDRLWFMESGSVDGDVQPVGDELFDPLGHVCVDGEVDGVYAKLFRLGEAVRDFVNPDDAGRAFEESPLNDTESDWSQPLENNIVELFKKYEEVSKSYPNADDITFLHASVNDSMIRRRQHV